jgi:hypothetical protein
VSAFITPAHFVFGLWALKLARKYIRIEKIIIIIIIIGRKS